MISLEYMLAIVAAYIACEVSLSLLRSYQSECVQFDYEYRHSWMFVLAYIIPILLTTASYYTKAKTVSGLLLSLVVYYMIWGAYTIPNILLHGFNSVVPDILRYNVYYTYALYHIDSIEKGFEKLPVYALVSNLGYVLQKRSDDISTIYPCNRIPETAAVVMLLAGGMLCYTCKRKYEKHELYTSEIKTKRACVLLALNVLSGMSSMLIVKSIEARHKVAVEPTDSMDIFPLLIAVGIALINSQLFKHVKYSWYAYFCPMCTIVMSAYMIAAGDGVPIYVARAVYVWSATMRYVLYDPIRYVLYITMQPNIISKHQSLDVLCSAVLYMVDKTVTIDPKQSYMLALIAGILWMFIAKLSMKYYKKDSKCIECTHMLELIV